MHVLVPSHAMPNLTAEFKPKLKKNHVSPTLPLPCLHPPSFLSLTLPFRHSRCSSPSSRSLSTLASSASVRRRTRLPIPLPISRTSQNKARLAPTSVRIPTTRRRTVRLPGVSAGLSPLARVDFFSLVNAIDDWCFWAPPNPGPDSVIGNTEVRRNRHLSDVEKIDDPFTAY